MRGIQGSVLTSKNFAFLLMAAMQEVGILQMTCRTARYAGHDAWISVLLAAVFPLAGLFLINGLCSRFPRDNLARISERVLGPVPGKAVSFAYVAYAMFNAAMAIRLFTDLANSFLLFRTPGWVLALALTLGAAYIFSRDIASIAWMTEFTFYLMQILWIALLASLSRADYRNLLPVGDNGLSNILLGMQGSFLSYIGAEILLVLYPLIQNKREVLRAGTLAVAWSAFSYTILALAVIMVFGGDLVSLFVWDALALIKTYHIPVIERTEFYVSIAFSWLALRAAAVLLYTARETISGAAGVSEKYRLYAVAILTAGTFMVALLPGDLSETVIYTKYVGLGGVSMMLGLPSMLWALAAIRGLRGT